MDVGCWMVGESGIKTNSAQFSWSLAELGNNSIFCLDNSISCFRLVVKSRKHFVKEVFNQMALNMILRKDTLAVEDIHTYIN